MKELFINERGMIPFGRFKIQTLESGIVVAETPWQPNLIMSADGYGIKLVARRLVGETTYGSIITHAKIGTGSNTPATSDTNLQTPFTLLVTATPAIDVTVGSVVSITTSHLEFFIPSAELTNQVYREWGLFVGTYGVDERIFARTLITPTYTKASGQDTKIIHEVGWTPN